MTTPQRTILTAILPLTVGTLIYLLFRADTLRVFDWLDLFGLKNAIQEVRQTEIIRNIKPNDIIKYSFADGLWIFSYTSAILILWDNKVTSKSIFWLTLLPSIGVITELAQLFGLCKGTFDIADIFCYITGFFIPILFFSNQKIKLHYEN